MKQRSSSVRSIQREVSSFMRPVQPDEILSAVAGKNPLSRSELTRKLWEYIHKHGLQDKERKVFIHADDVLRPIFNGRGQVTMVELGKLISSHLLT